MIRTIEIGLTIPDNEAYTALTTLQRLGFELEGLRRMDVWRFEIEPSYADSLVEQVRTLETIYNPNKHELRVRTGDHPAPGEAWIEEPGHGVLERPVRISGRVLPGVERAARSVSWRLEAPGGKPASAEVVRRAVEILLCNPAFQKATI
jgi:phosphoribosylformylglycinamidine (FGAM) synthase PurS component